MTAPEHPLRELREQIHEILAAEPGLRTDEVTERVRRTWPWRYGLPVVEMVLIGMERDGAVRRLPRWHRWENVG